VIGYGHDANHEDRATVIYIGLQLSQASHGPRFSTRTAESDDPNVDAWFDFVHENGAKCVCVGTDCPGRCPRFEYVGPEWNPRP